MTGPIPWPRRSSAKTSISRGSMAVRLRSKSRAFSSEFNCQRLEIPIPPVHRAVSGPAIEAAPPAPDAFVLFGKASRCAAPSTVQTQPLRTDYSVFDKHMISVQANWAKVRACSLVLRNRGHWDARFLFLRADTISAQWDAPDAGGLLLLGVSSN